MESSVAAGREPLALWVINQKHYDIPISTGNPFPELVRFRHGDGHTLTHPKRHAVDREGHADGFAIRGEGENGVIDVVGVYEWWFVCGHIWSEGSEFSHGEGCIRLV